MFDTQIISQAQQVCKKASAIFPSPNDLPVFYIFYGRKSREDKDSQIRSIDDQLNKAKECQKRENLHFLNFDSPFREEKSASKPYNRPEFQEMIKCINEYGNKINLGIWVWDPSRLSRNSVDEGILIHLLKEGFLKEIRTATNRYRNTPEDIFCLKLSFSQSEKYTGDLSRNVKRGMDGKHRDGELCSMAPFGFRNYREGKIAKLKLVDEEVYYIKQLYLKYSSRQYSLHDLAQYLMRNNVLTRRHNATWTAEKVRKILCQPLNVGYLKPKKEHMALNPCLERFLTIKDLKQLTRCTQIDVPPISPKLFINAQRIMFSKTSKPLLVKTEKEYFIYRLFVKCMHCRKSLSGYRKKGHAYYKCTNKECCEKTHISEKKITKNLVSILGLWEFSDTELELAAAWFSKENKQFQQEISKLEKELNLQKEKLFSKIKMSEEAYFEKVFSLKKYQEIVDDAKYKIGTVNKQLDELSHKKKKNQLQIVNFLELGEKASELYKMADGKKKRTMLDRIFLELFVNAEKKVLYTPNEEFVSLFNREVYFGRPDAFFLELLRFSEQLESFMNFLSS